MRPPSAKPTKVRGRGACLAALIAALALCAAAPPTAAQASPGPLFTYAPSGESFVPPPAGQLEGPCGAAVDSAGHFYVADYYHDAVDAFEPPASPFSQPPEYLGQISGADPADGPCGLAVDSTGRFYADSLHSKVSRYASFPGGAKTTLDPGPATGVAVDPATRDVYVDRGTYLAAYDSSGAAVEVGGRPLHVGEGGLQDGYGIAISGYPATAGFLYVPDAATETVKVYDPATDTENPIEVIDAHASPAGAFSSLRDAAIAVDDETGEVYVADDLQPDTAEEPEAAVYVFSLAGAYEGRLKYNLTDARPPGLAVDNSGTASQGRVYLTSGNSEKASAIAYPPGAAGAEALPAPEGPAPLPPVCSCSSFPEPPPPVTCEGDSCQKLPSEPGDPTLTTLLEGPGNRPVHFYNTNRLSHFHRLHDHHHRRRRGKKGRGRHGKRLRKRATSSAIVRKGSLQIRVSGGIAPKRLPREGTAPVSVSVSGRISTSDGSPPPELRKLQIELNRHGGLETKGLPVCHIEQIHPASTQRALAACGRSLVGTGSFSVDVVLAGQEPYPTTGRLLLFNGVFKGKHALLGQIYSAHPFATSFVIPFTIGHKRKGRYGLVLTAKLPEALISWGRVTGLAMKLQRRYSYGGRRRSFASAGCPAPKGFGAALFVLARTTFSFSGHRRLSETLTGHCGVRG